MRIKYPNLVRLLVVLAMVCGLVAVVAAPAGAQGCEATIGEGTTVSAPPGAGAQVVASGLQVGAIASFYFDGVKTTTVPANPEVEALDGGVVQFSYTVPTVPYGEHTLKVTDGANCAEWNEFVVEPILQITVPASKKGPVGTTVTITGKGFNDGVGATVFIGPVGDETFLAAVPLVDSTGSFSVQGQIPPLQSGIYMVWAIDKAVESACTCPVHWNNSDYFTVTPSLSVSPTSGLAGSNVVLTGSGWTEGNVTISFAQVAGPASVPADVHGAINVTYQIPTAATPGITQIRGDQGELSATTLFTVVARALSLTPTSGPKGTKVLVTGSNMTKGNETANIPINYLDFGTFNWNTAAAIAIDTSGTIRPTSLYIDCGFLLGTNTVLAVDTSALVAMGTFTVTKPTITIDPITGPAGTTVVVRGEGWVSGKIVSIFQGVDVAQTIIPGADGKFAGTVIIAGPNPGPVTIQAKDFVTGTATACNTSDAKTFTIPGAALTVTPGSGPATTTVALSGTGFMPYWPVTVSIGGYDLTTQALTGATGAFTYTFAVPGLAPGVAVIMAEDAQNTVTTFFTITAAPVSIQTQLASISSCLVRVWGYFGGAWQLYDPADVAGSDLKTLTSTRGYWINVNCNTEIVYGAYSRVLTSGWNLVGW